MSRSQYVTPKSKTPRVRSVGLLLKSVPEEQVKYVSAVMGRLNITVVVHDSHLNAQHLLGTDPYLC